MVEGIFWRGKFWRIAGGAPDGEGEGGTGQEKTDDGSGGSGDGGNTGGDGSNTGGSGSGDDNRRFSQQDVDRIVADRLKRERDKSDQEKARLAREAQEKAAKEQGEFQTLAEQRQARIAELEADSAAKETKLKETQMRYAIMAEAASAGAVDPEAVYALLDKSALEVDDAGQVKGAKQAVKALLEAKTYLKKPGTGTKGVPETGNGSGDGGKDFETRVQDTRKELQRTGQYGRL